MKAQQNDMMRELLFGPAERIFSQTIHSPIDTISTQRQSLEAKYMKKSHKVNDILQDRH